MVWQDYSTSGIRNRRLEERRLLNGPLVSVIIPAYNRAHTVAETIDSVLAQTYPNLEVIVVDDGSQDNTPEVLRSYGTRIKNIRQENAGQMVARNRGIAESHGEIVTFLDSDDIWLPACVERHVSLLQRVKPEVPCSLANGWLEFSDGRRITSFQNSALAPGLEEGLWLNVPEVLPTRFVMFCQFVAIRREALQIVRGFDEDLKYMEDYALPLRLSLLGPWGFIREPLVVWRQGAADTVSVSQRALKQARPLRESLLTIRKRYLHDIAGQAKYKTARKLQERELFHDQLELRAIDLRNDGSKIFGDLLFNAVRYRKAVYRRLPAFAKMNVAKLSN
jgi:glycosyltransferase involved in cell wall biosynthesis